MTLLVLAATVALLLVGAVAGWWLRGRNAAAGLSAKAEPVLPPGWQVLDAKTAREFSEALKTATGTAEELLERVRELEFELQVERALSGGVGDG
ncbi:hypothetical protein GCM10009743_42040 [Kribbella swartbergensis]